MKKILVIEDDKNIARAIRARLMANGYDVTHAPDAVFAMNSAIKDVPDIVLLDINLPGGDGFLIAERLRENTATSKASLIFMTASKKQTMRDDARNAGAVAFLEKPFSATQLIDAIASC